jgi:hypothetical protein
VAGYRIRVRGHLGPTWAGWFDGLRITNLPNGDAELAGHLTDETALYGVLLKIRDLNLTLVSVRRLCMPARPG